MSELKTGSDFIRAYDKSHPSIEPAAKVVAAGKEQGHAFGMNLVYEVRRRDRAKFFQAKNELPTGKGTKPQSLSIILRGRDLSNWPVKVRHVPSAKQQANLPDFFDIRGYRRQFIESVKQLGLVEVRALLAQIEA